MSALKATLDEIKKCDNWSRIQAIPNDETRRRAFNALDPNESLLIGSKLLIGDDLVAGAGLKVTRETPRGDTYGYAFVLTSPNLMRLRLDAQHQTYKVLETVTDEGPQFRQVQNPGQTHIDGVYRIAKKPHCVIPFGGATMNNYWRPYGLGLAHGEDRWTIKSTLKGFEGAMLHIFGEDFQPTEIAQSDGGAPIKAGLRDYSETDLSELVYLTDCAVHLDKDMRVPLDLSVAMY
jgi:hypothetical protein